ncbi:MAG TPA: lytic murein transglycosylase [Candidatus Binatia bacterium]|nr:lytic murein transglycosylase [Candidatus Binatia bacterium]
MAALCLGVLFLAAASAIPAIGAQKRSDGVSFEQWVKQFRARAIARGVSAATYARVTEDLQPDTSVFEKVNAQPEFHEEIWQYLNRRVSEFRINVGREKLKEHGALLARIEKDYGVPAAVLVGLWGIESSFGDPLVQKNHMRPVFPSLAALAWGEPRRRTFWEAQLLHAFVIVERGWAKPAEMTGSWAGAMGHTQWMPEVWLNIGVDYDGDERVFPFGRPDDALAGSARYLVKRGKYRRGEHWGYEVRIPAGIKGEGSSKSYAAWHKAGVQRADGKPFPQPKATAKLWVPVKGGPAFLLGPNFYAVRSYNPSMSYTLAILHLGDRIAGGGPFLQPFPGGERAPTMAELQELQRRLTELGFDTGGVDGRVGTGTMTAVQKFQKKVGMTPADGYPGVKVLQKLREMQ